MAKRKPTAVAYAADDSGNPITGSTAVAELPIVNAVVDDLRETARVITAAEMDQYRELVTRVADGSKFDDSEKASARELLKSIGRTFEDLASDADLLRSIRGREQQLVGYEPKKSAAELAEFKKQYEEAQAAADAARRRWREAVHRYSALSTCSASLRLAREQFAERTGGEA